MTMIGKPPSANQNQFNNVTMAPSRPLPLPGESDKEQGVGDKLNKMSGVKPEARFVDRKKHDELGQDGFMKLLAHQLKNQDPMKPMDQKDFSANLAQFSTLEQMTQMNKKMEAFNSNNTQEKKFQGASFLGKKVVTSGTTIDYSGDGKDVNLPFFLEKNAKNAIVHIYDNKNQMIGKMDLENLPKGQQSITWDGIGLDGQIAPKETYHFDVVAFDEGNEKFLGLTKAEGLVTGVRFENGETIFDLASGKKVYLKDVESFSMPDNMVSKKMPALQKDASRAYNQVENQF